MRKNFPLRRALIIFSSISGALIAVGLLSFAIFVWHVDATWSDLIEPRIRERQSSGSIRVMARDANLQDRWIGSLSAGRFEERKVLTLDQVPAHLVQSIVVLEDPRFLGHQGFDLYGIARAFFVNLRSLRFAQGGSTLTQQLVKNIFLSHERTLKRKFTELVLAALVEQRFEKDEILETYMNEVYLGQVGGIEIRGVGRASQYYFSKPANELAVHESALLAAMIAGPGVYSPWRNPEGTTRRRNRVLNAMAEAGLILPEELESSLSLPLPTASKYAASTRAAYLLDALRVKLIEERGEEAMLKGGFDVTLSIDLEMQEAAERTLATTFQGKDPKQQALIVGADPRDCTIKVYAGGTQYRVTQLDRIRQSKRQIGSLVKPLEIMPLLQTDSMKLNLATRLVDQPLKWTYDRGRQSWSPVNYDGLFRDKPVSLRDALELSLNVPFARIFFDRYPSGDLVEAFDVLRALGLDIPPERALPSATLGAIEQTPWDTLHAFVKVVRQSENLSADVPDLGCRLGFEAVQQTEPEVPGDAPMRSGARLTLAALEGALRRGTGKALGAQLPVSQAWASKSGTSSDKRDAWFVVMSPKLVLLAWTGNDDNSETTHTGSTGALPLLAPVLKAGLVKNQEESWQWAEVPNVSWQLVDQESVCQVSDVRLPMIQAAFPIAQTTTPPLENFSFQGRAYRWELFSRDAQLEPCE